MCDSLQEFNSKRQKSIPGQNFAGFLPSFAEIHYDRNASMLRVQQSLPYISPNPLQLVRNRICKNNLQLRIILWLLLYTCTSLNAVAQKREQRKLTFLLFLLFFV